MHDGLVLSVIHYREEECFHLAASGTRHARRAARNKLHLYVRQFLCSHLQETPLWVRMLAQWLPSLVLLFRDFAAFVCRIQTQSLCLQCTTFDHKKTRNPLRMDRAGHGFSLRARVAHYFIPSTAYLLLTIRNVLNKTVQEEYDVLVQRRTWEASTGDRRSLLSSCERCSHNKMTPTTCIHFSSSLVWPVKFLYSNNRPPPP